MSTFTHSALPAWLAWKNTPVEFKTDPSGALTIVTGEKTDWFIDPAGTTTAGNAPVALFTPPDAVFMLSAKITVEFGSMYDAGVLFLHVRDDLWGKLCFEYSPQGQPMVVSVITRGTSDDCNSVVIEGNTVYLRVASFGQAFAYHYSLDGVLWHFVRYFTLGNAAGLRVGFSAQSPTGKGCKAAFADIHYRPEKLADLRSGE